MIGNVLAGFGSVFTRMGEWLMAEPKWVTDSLKKEKDYRHELEEISLANYATLKHIKRQQERIHKALQETEKILQSGIEQLHNQSLSIDEIDGEFSEIKFGWKVGPFWACGCLGAEGQQATHLMQTGICPICNTLRPEKSTITEPTIIPNPPVKYPEFMNPNGSVDFYKWEKYLDRFKWKFHIEVNREVVTVRHLKNQSEHITEMFADEGNFSRNAVDAVDYMLNGILYD